MCCFLFLLDFVFPFFFLVLKGLLLSRLSFVLVTFGFLVRLSSVFLSLFVIFSEMDLVLSLGCLWLLDDAVDVSKKYMSVLFACVSACLYCFVSSCVCVLCVMLEPLVFFLACIGRIGVSESARVCVCGKRDMIPGVTSDR